MCIYIWRINAHCVLKIYLWKRSIYISGFISLLPKKSCYFLRQQLYVHLEVTKVVPTYSFSIHNQVIAFYYGYKFVKYVIMISWNVSYIDLYSRYKFMLYYFVIDGGIDEFTGLYNKSIILLGTIRPFHLLFG